MFALEPGRRMIPKGLSVVLVEPQYPVNVGHIARVAKNFGVKKLCLIDPKVDMSVASVYAAHAAEVLESARVISFARLRRESQLLVATTAVRASRGSNVTRRMVKPEKLSSIVGASKTSALVFGRDSTGLTNDEIAACDVTTTLDTGTGYRTLNVGHAVAILLYLIRRGDGGEGHAQSREARELFARSFYELALESRLASHRAKNMKEVAKRIAASSGLTDSQLYLMTGVFRKATSTMNWGQARDSKT